MPKKGELSKTARASLANREALNHMTSRVCVKCGERINYQDLQMVKVIGPQGQFMEAYHKEHFKI